MSRRVPALRRGALLFGIVAASLVAAFVVLTAAGLGGGSDSTPTKTSALPKPPATNHLTAVQKYSQEISVREGVGSPTLNEQPPIDPRRFRRPIAQYKSYALKRTTQLRGDVAGLQAAIARGSRTAARAAWRTTFADYLRLGAVYGAFGALDGAIDGLPGGLAKGVGDPRFTGLHRIEHALWSPQPVSAVAPVAARLARDIGRLRRAIPTAEITPLDYATRAHEIIEDDQRDFLTGADVPWSDEGVLATSAGLEATRVVIRTLRPLLGGQDALDPTLLGLSRLTAAIARIRRAHHGRLPTLAGLTAREHELLDARVSWALERLQRIPGSLETTDPPAIPRLRTSR